jgi:hypothetical protein
VHSLQAIQSPFIESDDYLNHSLKLRKAEYNLSAYGLHRLLAAWRRGLRHPDFSTIIRAMAFSIRICSTIISQYYYTKRKSADSFMLDELNKCSSEKCMVNPKEPSNYLFHPNTTLLCYLPISTRSQSPNTCLSIFFATRQKTIDTLAVRGVAQFRGMIVSLIACLELFLVFNLKWTLLSDIEESMKEYFTPHTGHETYFEDASMLGRTSTFDFLACEYI